MYRRTARERERIAARQRSIAEAARRCVRTGGFSSATIKAVAAEAGCSTGLVYQYFASRDELLRTTFSHAAGHELDALRAATAEARDLHSFTRAYIRTFCTRAFAGRPLARALLFDTVPEAVRAERLAFRADYAAVFSAGIDRFAAAGPENPGPETPGSEASGADTADADPSGAEPGGGAVQSELLARAVVGACAETLTEPLLASDPTPPAEQEALITALTTVCLRILGLDKEHP